MSINSFQPDDRVFTENFFSEIQDALIRSAEGVLQKALQDIEVVMRAELARMMIARLQTDFDVRRDQTNLVITAKGFFNAKTQ